MFTLLVVAFVAVIMPPWRPAWVETAWLPAAFVAATVFGLMLHMRE
jgi:hypothetical protein